METKLGVVKIKKGSEEKLKIFFEMTNKNKELAKEHMKDRGYYWDSVFLDPRIDGTYLIYVVKSLDFSKINIKNQYLLNKWSRKYLEFKTDCWANEKLLKLDSQLSKELKF